jgi:hypothetical protein
MPGKGWVRWTAEEQRVLARCARGVERGRYEAVARAARAFLRDVEQLRAVGGVPAGVPTRNYLTVHGHIGRILGSKRFGAAHTFWTPEEDRTVERYVRDWVGGLSGLEAAASRCLAELSQLHRQRPTGGGAPAPRTFTAVWHRIIRLARAAGHPSVRARWTPKEQEVVERYAAALVEGRCAELRVAAKRCCAELAESLRGLPDADRRAVRAYAAVRDRLAEQAGALGWTQAATRWLPQEKVIMERYIAGLASGKYSTVYEAARDCCTELTGFHSRLRKRESNGEQRYRERSFSTIQTYLLRWSRDSGRAPRTRGFLARWTPEEARAAEQAAKGLAGGSHRSVAASVQAFEEELTRSGVSERHTKAAVAVAICGRAQALGWRSGRVRWTNPEARIADRFARSIASGRYENVSAAVADCRQALEGAGLASRHSVRTIRTRLQRRSLAFGRTRRYSHWKAREIEIADRFARDLVRGRYPSAAAAAADCGQELARVGLSVQGTRSRVTPRLLARARLLGWNPQDTRWTAAELQVVDHFAQATVAGGYARPADALSDCRRELDQLHLRPDRTDQAIVARLRRQALVRGLSRKWRAWSDEENRILRRYAQCVVRGEYRSIPAALPDCKRALVKAGLLVHQHGNLVGSKLEKMVLASGRRVTLVPWTEEEERVLSRYVEFVVDGRYRSAQEAADFCRREIARLRRVPGERSDASVHTLNAVRSRLWERLTQTGKPRPHARWTPAEQDMIDQYARAVLDRRYRSAARASSDCSEAIRKLDMSVTQRNSAPAAQRIIRRQESVHCALIERMHELGRHQYGWRRWTTNELKVARRWRREYALYRRGKRRANLGSLSEMMRAELDRLGYFRTRSACAGEILTR